MVGTGPIPGGTPGSRAALFLDRDGTINRTDVVGGRPFAPVRFEDFDLLPGVAETVGAVRAAGHPVIVVTNQPDVSTGKQSQEILARMHRYLVQELEVDDIFVCTHVNTDGCGCRKPKPGLILDAARKWQIDCGQSVMVGDRWKDVEAGRAAGCATVFIDCNYDEPKPEGADFVVDSLSAARSFILETLKAGVGAGA